MITIRVAHSPDADDAFMFFALATGKIPTGDRHYVHELSDIETLNRKALAGELEVTAVSIHAYAYLSEQYVLLSHGASIGDRYGPRLVSMDPAPPDPCAGVVGKRIAIPGTLTTAALTLQLFQPRIETVVMPFDRIEQAVLDRQVDAGVLIHEGQLTYADQGLHLWADMGEWWFGETGLPLPLGGNVVRRDLGEALIREISRDLRASISHALEHRNEALAHAMDYGRNLDPDQVDRFVGMYVNDFTLDYGESGRKAVQLLLDRAVDAGLLQDRVTVTFVDDGAVV